MKTNARSATIFIFLFFLLFNGIQLYLILQRIAAAKAKYNTACTNALQSTLFQYNKLKGAADTSSRPKQALILFSLNEFTVNRKDSQNIEMKSTTSRLNAIRVDPATVEGIINRPRSASLDLAFLGNLYSKALDSFKVHAEYRLDTFAINRTPKPGTDIATQVRNTWTDQRTKKYPYATNPQRMFFSPNTMIFAELKSDYRFFRNDLLWPMLAFFFILLISNTALVFVYKTIRKQKRINEVKTDFINNITHEMKTPITIASASLDALQHHIPVTERTGFYVNTSKRHLRVLNDFVERILDAAVQEVPDFHLKKERIDLHTLLEDLVQSHSILKGKPVSFQLTGEGPIFIQGDRLHLETAFHNIIDNAIKYSGSSVEIHIDIAENNRDCTIKIRDNGRGIPPEYIKNIFEKFFRVPQGDAQQVKGFGLGLYYVNSIVKKHSGQITVQSKLESGTEFIITLPKKYDTDPVDRRPG